LEAEHRLSAISGQLSQLSIGFAGTTVNLNQKNTQVWFLNNKIKHDKDANCFANKLSLQIDTVKEFVWQKKL